MHYLVLCWCRKIFVLSYQSFVLMYICVCIWIWIVSRQGSVLEHHTSHLLRRHISINRLTSSGRLLEFTFLRRGDVSTWRRRDQCMTSSRRRDDVIFFEGFYSPRSYGAEFVCFLFVRHATMLGTESLDGVYTHWTWGNGHKPPGQKSPGQKTPGQKHPRPKAATYSIAAVAGNWTILVTVRLIVNLTIYEFGAKVRRLFKIHLINLRGAFRSFTLHYHYSVQTSEDRGFCKIDAWWLLCL